MDFDDVKKEYFESALKKHSRIIDYIKSCTDEIDYYYEKLITKYK